MLKISILLFLLLSTTSAGMWTTVSGFGTKEIDPDVTYTLDTIGQNPRVYEFTPKNNTDYICIIVYTEGDNKSPTMQCIPRKIIKK